MLDRMNFLYRLASTAKVGWSSSITFATVGTALSTLVIVPGLSVLFNVLLGRDLSAPDPVRIACASALASVVLGVAAGVVARAATDRWLGVFEQVCTARRFDAAYWLGVSAVPALLTLITGVTNLGVAAAYAGVGSSFEGALPLLARSVALLPLALVAGVCLGVFAAGLGLYLSDPYLGVTILGALLPISAGVIVPVSAYPAWLAALCALIPGGRTVALVGGSPEAAGSTVLTEVLVCVLWALAGLTLVHAAARRIRSGARANLL